jgi:ubiquinone biosynthesis protein
MQLRTNLFRLAHIIRVVARHALAHALGPRLARWPGLARRLPAAGLSGPERLRAVIEDLGGTFIKLGQMLSLQPDILSLEYCRALFNLLDRVAPFTYEQVEKTFREELGRPPSELFDHFEVSPLATASIGQVHAAYVGGRKVAVKVQRPSVETDFAGDIQLMMGAVKLIKRLRLKSFYWVVEPLSEFVVWTREELDYRREARYMEQMRANSLDTAYERIPEVFWDYTTRRTLVVEFFEGVTVLDYLRALEAGDEEVFRRLQSSGFEPNRFACNIVDNFLRDACRHGMFHADLHPANLMILPGNVVGYVDFGITGLLSHYSSHNLVTLTLAFTRADLKSLYDSFVSSLVLGGGADLEGFRHGLKTLSGEWYEIVGGETRLRKSFTLVMLDMLELSRRTDVCPARDVIKYIRSAIAVDGLIARFAPAFNLSRYLEVICDRYLKWEARRELFSYDTFVRWSSSSGRLMRDGALRAADFLRRVADAELSAHAEGRRGVGEGDGALRQALVKQAAVIFAVSLLVTLTGSRAEFGVNLFTAGATVAAAAAVMLVRANRRLERSG